MEVISILNDFRINSTNVLAVFTIKEYLAIAKDIMDNNPYQRKKVKSSGTVYSLLRDDLKQGCIIPPIVLAINTPITDQKRAEEDKSFFANYISEHIANGIILDGLQRTNNVIDAYEEIKKENDEKLLDKYLNYKIRVELYFGINKIGILYRMLTLNTGQTPMSIRHQIEMLYSDYLKLDTNGIKLLREVDNRQREVGVYSFKDIIEGFTSYLMQDYLTFDRGDLLENIKSLEKLSKENVGADIFKNYLEIFHSLLRKLIQIMDGWEFADEDTQYQLRSLPFGKDVFTVFSKSQVMTGLGAALSFLTERNISNFERITGDITLLKINSTPSETMHNLLFRLDDLKINASKIGNSQREFFYYFFRELFNSDGDSYLFIDDSIEAAYRRYKQNN